MLTKTFAMIKPDAIHRGLSGEIISRIERRGLTIVGLKLINVTEEQAQQHYAPLKERPFFEDLVRYIMSGPVIVMAIQGENANQLIRNMAGDTDPTKALSGTIRGDFSADIQNNIIHTADSAESALRELNIYFSEEELIKYFRVTDTWSFHQKRECDK